MTNPRGAGLVGVVVVALIAGAGAIVAVSTVQPAPPRPDRAVGTPAHAPAGTIDPPADVVAPLGTIGPDWCPAGSISIEIETADSALGHREAVLRATNVGDTACVLDGYPDIAIADADGGEIPLEIVHGSSFMATDPQPSRVVVEPGHGAASVLGWDATDGRSGIGAVHVAGYAGIPRVALVATWDMTPVTRIAVTAWQPD